MLPERAVTRRRSSGPGVEHLQLATTLPADGRRQGEGEERGSCRHETKAQVLIIEP